jgi:FAD/FMN-containing dehydrogenase
VREAWVDEFAAALQQRDDGAYVGFLTDEGPPASARPTPGASWDRLVQVKTRYDPTNLFHHNHNIPTVIAEPGQ